ncbi:MAG: tetratricopeptide repeat protein, partial [Pseudomonadota bacterium]
NANDDDLRAVASLRLARVLLEQGELDQALAALPSAAPAAFTGLIETVRGDILLAQNKPGDAQSAYERARDSDTEVADAAMLEMQILDLAGRQ